MSWQPIETAPKEREKNVLLLCSNGFDSYENSITVGFWGRHAPFSKTAKKEAWCDWCAGLDHSEEWQKIHPTHWMPLPPEPTE